MHTNKHRPQRKAFRDEISELHARATRKDAGGKRRRIDESYYVDRRLWRHWLDD